MKFVQATTKGSRTRNEDYTLGSLNDSLFIIADGMRGHDNGDYASYFAVKKFFELFHKYKEELDEAPTIILDYIINTVNNELRTIEDLKKRKERFGEHWNKFSNILNYKSMGTTLSALLLLDDFIFICHTGDTRIYEIVKDEIRQLTRDYNDTEYKNIITSCLGVKKFDYQIESFFAAENSRFILSSDGLHNHIKNEDLIRYSEAIEKNCDKLIDLAIKNGSDDNISVMIINT